MKTDLLDPTERRSAMLAAFTQQWKADPTLWVRAPGRVDLMGSHTDYNEGFVLTLSIDRDTWIAARPIEGTRCRVYSLNMNESAEFDLNDKASGPTTWITYVQGVVIVMREAGYNFPAFEAVIHGTVPIASGLSSSASLESATGTLLEQLGGHHIDRVELAKLCQRAENQVVGVNCGILDQYSSILGRQGQAILLDCRDLTCSHAPVAEGLRIVIADTRAPRKLSGSEYGERRGHCEEGARLLARHAPAIRALRDVSTELFAAHAAELTPIIAKRCQFVLQENQRVLDLAKALQQNDRTRIKTLCDESFAGARDMYEISVPAMEAMIAAMNNAPGVVGARQAGAGFGGCMVAIVDQAHVTDFISSVAAQYKAATQIDGEFYEVQIAAGAGEL
jgi:galactokinase